MTLLCDVEQTYLIHALDEAQTRFARLPIGIILQLYQAAMEDFPALLRGVEEGLAQEPKDADDVSDDWLIGHLVADVVMAGLAKILLDRATGGGG